MNPAALTAALREALAAPEPKPVARCILDNGDEMGSVEWLVRPRSIRLDHGSLLYAAPPAAPASQWMPIETAPKDGTPVLLLTNERWKDCRPGTQFVGINRGNLSEWCFYAPVGMGGIPDAWLDGWTPLPAAPDHLHDIAEKVAPPAAPAPAVPRPQTEQDVFEDWLVSKCPSGDVDEVQRKWEASSELADFLAESAAPAVPAVCDGGTCGLGGYCANCPRQAAAPAVPSPNKPTVQRLMDLARKFRSAPGDLYDDAYKELERACYEALSATPAVPQEPIYGKYTADDLVRGVLQSAAPAVPLTDEQRQRIHNETGAGHSLICLVESYINAITGASK